MANFLLFVQNPRKKNSKRKYGTGYMIICSSRQKFLKSVLKNSFLSSPPSQLYNLRRQKKTFTRISCTKGAHCQLTCTTNASGLHAKYIKESQKGKKEKI